MGRLRQGFTLTEMLVVVVMVGMMTLITLPKFSGLVERNKLSAAREEMAAAIATARAAAVQKGRTATFKVVGNRMWVTAVSTNGATTTTVLPMKNLGTLYNVSVTATDSAVTYDMRGFARLSSTGIFRIIGTSRRDSLCITTAGQIMPKGCSL